MFDLTGKTALITGASGGIGGDIARALHAAGATVGLSGTREAPLQELAAELGERAHVLPCNLSDAEAVEALPKQAIAAMGSVDILVNNAGITRDNLFMRMKDEEWASVLEVIPAVVSRASITLVRRVPSCNCRQPLQASHTASNASSTARYGRKGRSCAKTRALVCSRVLMSGLSPVSARRCGRSPRYRARCR